MRHQQVVIDYWTMLKTSCTCLLLAISGYVLIKMVQTIFYLPGHLKNNQKRLEELAAKYNLDLDKEVSDAEVNAEYLSIKNQNETSTIKKFSSEESTEPKKIK